MSEEDRYALISVTNKQGVVPFGKGLQECGYNIVSTGGTAETLTGGGVDVIPVEEWTGFPEMLSGRVKTLHPRIHAGILARRSSKDQMKELEEQNIKPIDLVVVNLYDFASAREKNLDMRQLVEQIDIGGPTMIRAAAKNYESVGVVTDPSDYDGILEEMEASGGELSEETKKTLAAKAFVKTASYDQMISETFASETGPEDDEYTPTRVNISLNRKKTLRYGENPHQKGALYTESSSSAGFAPNMNKIHGKEISYNNLYDMDSAYRTLGDLERPSCVVIKHGIPCGAAKGGAKKSLFRRARSGDPVSSFGSVVGFNTEVTLPMAEDMADPDLFLEGVIAPSFEEGVVDVFSGGPSWGKRVRLIEHGDIAEGSSYSEMREIRGLSGGYLVQTGDGTTWDEDSLEVVSGELTDQIKEELRFAWILCKHVRSNAIVIAREGRILGTGAGQPSRVDAAEIAVKKAGKDVAGSVMASDAFFPFPDALERGIDAGIKAAVQPGGSIRDEQVIEAAKKANITMVLTGIRHFKH